jgi:Sec-independent protein translocase protein TatA
LFRAIEFDNLIESTEYRRSLFKTEIDSVFDLKSTEMEVPASVIVDVMGKLAGFGPVWLSLTIVGVVFVIQLPAIIREAGPHILEWRKMTNRHKDNAAKIRNATADKKTNAVSGPSVKQL